MLYLLPAMLITLLSLATAVPSCAGQLQGIQRRDTSQLCGSTPSSETVDEMEKDFAAILEQMGTSADASDAGSFTVPVYFNVIYASTAPSDGNIQ